mgnify:CR=1 FL=1|tara:strand:+ start:3348 stop:3905 length:558 start_codon:yes stop_codon:yes gene_type:complete
MISENEIFVEEAWKLIISNVTLLRLKYCNFDGQEYWNQLKKFFEIIDLKTTKEIFFNPIHLNIFYQASKLLDHLDEKDKNGKIIERNHFLLQLLNIPYKDKKASMHRLMQIALNIGQFNNFNNENNFSKEIVDFTIKNRLSDIKTYMTPENYSKIDFTIIDFNNLKKLIDFLNKKPPLKITNLNF